MLAVLMNADQMHASVNADLLTSAAPKIGYV